MFSMEALKMIIDEAEYFKRRVKFYKITNRNSYFKLIRNHHGHGKIEWVEAQDRYTAEFRRTFTDNEVIFRGIYTKNGRPVQYQKIKNSYRRMLVKGA